MLRPLHFSPLPLGCISPRGWLRRQLEIQAGGLTGHLDEFWPSVAGSRWIGGEEEGWERGPYWLDGLIPLAFLLGDERLIGKARHWVEAILDAQHADGWLGAKDDDHEGIGEQSLDPWPLFVLFKAFWSFESATGDARILRALLRCARRVDALLDEKPLDSWAQVRWMEWVLSLHALYERTGEAWLLESARKAHDQGFDWRALFENDYPHTEKTDPQGLEEGWKLPLHGVNNAMALKGGALWWRQSGEEADLRASFQMLQTLERFHGQNTGMFSGDEHLAGRSPSQGTETCTIVEMLFSLETLISISGDATLGDQIERIAFNALPSALTKEMWARQYDSQPNQVWCSHARREWVSNGADSNLFSLEGNFGCCTANFHQGWPKFAQSAWMKTPTGLAATLLLPSRVECEIGGQSVAIECETSYPFGAQARFRIHTSAPLQFELQIRVPHWANGATIEVGSQTSPVRPGFWSETRSWRDGAEITLRLPMETRIEERPQGAVSLLLGPLVLALPIPEKWRQLRAHPDESRAADTEVAPDGAWNYALDLTNSSFQSHTREIGETPWATDLAPIRVEVAARRLESWGLQNDSAAPPPQSPVESDALLETLELIPFGSTTLRISEFPVVKED